VRCATSSVTLAVHVGERLLVSARDGLVVDGRVTKRRDDRVRAPLGDVAQRVVRLAVRQLVDELRGCPVARRTS
jgi:hypothetical protein